MLNNAPKNTQQGFTLVELLVTLSIMAVLNMYAQTYLARQSEEILAQGSAKYIAAVSNAAQAHVVRNFDSYSNSTPVAGVAVLLQPTVAELVALNRLDASFPSGPNALPTRQTLQINITQTSCPGVDCVLSVLACTTTPVTMGGPNVRFDLASTMTSAQEGSGGQSLPGQGAVIRGPLMSSPNPMGNVEGIVCGTSKVDTAFFQQFVRVGDTRDPSLAGPLTVAGATKLNSSLDVAGTVTAATALNVGPCINMNGASGKAGFGCQNGSNLPAGYTGGVRSVDVVANKNILASDNPAAFNGNNTNFAMVTANNGSGVAEVRTSGRSAGDRLTPTGTYAIGNACPASDEGSIARRLGGTGLVTCQGGVWTGLILQDAVGAACAQDGVMSKAANGVSLLCVGGVFQGMDTIVRQGAAGAPCPVAGATAIDTANGNETLICRQNLSGGAFRYMRLRDVTTQLAFVTAIEVVDGQVVNKPNCQASGAQPATPIIQMIPKVFNSVDGGYAVFAVDNGANWTTKLRTGSGIAMPGTPIAVAQMFCYFN